MNHVLTFAFIGGDLRQLRVIAQLAKEGHHIKTIGLDIPPSDDYAGIYHAATLEECIKDASVAVLPLPYNNTPETINTGLSKASIKTQLVLEAMTSKQILLAGHSDGYLKALAEFHSIVLIDYLEREELSILNVIPTVEGAIQIAMEETPYTLHGSRCLVLGYGRIGKYLSHALKSLGAVTSVAARKHRDLAWIKTYGMQGISFEELSDVIEDFDIIFNTVPVTVLDFPLLSKLPQQSLIIDLASKPGGVDFKTAQELGKKVIWALSLPGKVAAQSAGDIIKDTIIHILEELEV